MAEGLLPHSHGDEQEIKHLKEKLSEINNFQKVADIFKQLDDSSRIRIFWLLCHCEECVVNISALIGMTSPAVSHHLRQLKSSGLIISRRKGKEVHYKAADTEQSHLLHLTIEKIMEITCPE
jgi:DNA-binding transcriptional ArsR family regulator